MSYKALGTIQQPELLQFMTEPFEDESEFTGHIVVHLNVSVSVLPGSSIKPCDLDVLVTLRHIDCHGKRIHYTGTIGDPVPITKGWLRVSHRKVAEDYPRNKPWFPHQEYTSADALPVEPNQTYAVDVEMW